jgi:hypothetical protein
MSQLDFTVMSGRNYIRLVVHSEAQPKLLVFHVGNLPPMQQPRSPSSYLEEEIIRRTNRLAVVLDSF